jgi:adenine-specific DNA-methyltransferase
MPNFENAFNTVCELVKDFKENENIYLSYKYNESQARKDFIDKFFIALGWDVNHDLQKNPNKQEVLIERTLDNQSRPDYTFYIDPNFNEPKFYVEAKKPSHDLLNSDYYFQAINYARFSNTPVTVLTDFEEFHILDSRYKPNINTVLKDQNHLVFKYNDYSDREKFAKIYYLFSRDEVANNSLMDYADKLSFNDKKRKKSGYIKGELLSIDEEFLLYLDNIRVRLAKAFKKTDASLSSEELTEATQRTIDRLVFIRFLEDKNIEPEDFVSKLGTSNKAWYDFINICRKLDAKYNGIVFKEHFIDNQNFGGPELGEFKNVCFEFSRKNSQSFNYNLIPIHILGSIYERFLGKVVNATTQRVKVEEKPEVRKAGGVYYTPKYIVDYIVKNTVGKLIENKSPNEISKLRFADIACGSGSFLIGVFETLLEYHNNYYWLNQEEAKKDKCIFKDGVPFLSIKQKQNILLNNIYGVDIDPQAVEVTQLSLALKMLEDESLATANQMQVLFHEQILPNLSKNIICGNSLIGTDIIYEDSSDAGLFERKRRITPEEEMKLRPMDFEKRFPHIFSNSPHNVIPAKSGIQTTNGFDAIVGNPPYDVLEKERLGNLTPHFALHEYINMFNHYNNAIGGKLNIYRLFIIKCLSLIQSQGLFGLIIPLSIVGDKSCNNTRKYLITSSSELTINAFPQKDIVSKRIFKDAKLSTCIVISRKKNNSTPYDTLTINTYPYNSFLDKHKFCSIKIEHLKEIDEENFPIPLINNIEWKLLYKVHTNSNNLNLSKLNNEIIIRRGEINQTTFRKYITELSLNNKRLIKGVQIGKYKFNTKLSQGKVEYFNEVDFLKSNNPREAANLKRIATQRITGVDEKLRIVATIIEPKAYFADSTNSIYLINDSKYSLNYILALMNSKLYQWRFKLTSTNNNVGTNELESLPFRIIDFQKTPEKQSHDRIVSLVNEMLEAKKQLQTIKTDRDKTYYENKCADLDHAIDSEVYKLYALTDEEIKIVEETQ